MAKTIGSFDLASLKNLRDDVTQYFWFESNSSSAWGSGAHVTLYPESQFTNPSHANYMKGQNIIMNTDGFSIRNGGLPMMVLDNDSLDFNAVDTSLGTYTTMATFGLTGATIGQTSNAHSVIDANGQRFYASDGTTQLANIGYGEGVNATGNTSIAPYYTLGRREDGSTIGNYSVAECAFTTASAYASHAEGHMTIASGSWGSHAEGELTIASAVYSHAEGRKTSARGAGSHAEGYCTHGIGSVNGIDASGNGSHAEGWAGSNTNQKITASGIGSHAEGYADGIHGNIEASGNGSHAQGAGTKAQSDYQTVIGTSNIVDSTDNYAFIIGNGTADNARSNALTVDWSGRISCGDQTGNFKSIFDIFYPVGSYYETSLSSDIPSGATTPNATDLANLGVTWFNPKYAWGGTWELEIAGQVHVSAGTGYSISGALTNTSDGGNKDAIVPYHRHRVDSVSISSSGGHRHQGTRRPINTASGSGMMFVGASTSTTDAEKAYVTREDSNGSHTHSVPSHNTNYDGESVTGANLPPYIVVNRWHRTA